MRTKQIHEDEDGPEDEAIHEHEDGRKKNLHLRTTQFMKTDLRTKQFMSMRTDQNKTSPEDDAIHEDGPK